MKKLDKLILTSFIGPFVLTFLVVVFLLLIQHMLKYFDDIIGKDIGLEVLSQLMFHFSIFLTPTAFPLAILLSSLMTFGNLSEYLELTAIKSAGISLLRVIAPIFMLVIGLTLVAFYFNNYFAPKSALDAYSLLYDIKQKKPALDLKEGAFYNGIPDLSIKVNRKDAESGKIWKVIIYDHRDKDGNKKVTLADSGRMYTVLNHQYLVLELYNGHSYVEGKSNAKTISSRNFQSKPESLSRVQFEKSKIALDLSSFDLKRTKKELFSRNRIMRNLFQLERDIDSLQQDMLEYKLTLFKDIKHSFTYLSMDRIPFSKELIDLQVLKDSLLNAKERKDSTFIATTEKVGTGGERKGGLLKPLRFAGFKTHNKVKEKESGLVEAKLETVEMGSKKAIDATFAKKKKRIVDKKKTEKLHAFITEKTVSEKALEATVNRVRQMKSKTQNSASRIEKTNLKKKSFEVQWHKIISNSFACLMMFFIGAPLGAIIKKGGLGIPVLISIFFFIVFYVIGMIGDKQAKLGLIDPLLGVWAANMILFPIGLLFLRQAHNDSRLFDADFYHVTLHKIIAKFKKR